MIPCHACIKRIELDYETFFLISRLLKIKSLFFLFVSVDCISQQRSEHS